MVRTTVWEVDAAIDRVLAGTGEALVLVEEFPEDLRAHIRYPEDLFSIQAQQYLTYHMQDVRVFYNKEDLWEIPREVFSSGDEVGNRQPQEQLMEPYFVYLQLPGETEAEYLLILPFVPAGARRILDGRLGQGSNQDHARSRHCHAAVDAHGRAVSGRALHAVAGVDQR